MQKRTQELADLVMPPIHTWSSTYMRASARCVPGRLMPPIHDCFLSAHMLLAFDHESLTIVSNPADFQRLAFQFRLNRFNPLNAFV
jgi:hypothetical protein